MKITNIIIRALILGIFFAIPGCTKTPEPDPCQLTKWPQTKEYEIKLAVNVPSSNPTLPGGSPGSQNPSDFLTMVVSGTIEKFECNDSTSGPVDLGNTYLTKGVDSPAPIDLAQSYWIGHVVYVYDLGNDKDHIDINLTIKITMADGNSYTCNASKEAYQDQIVVVPGENYYYILVDIYSDSWVKV